MHMVEKILNNTTPYGKNRASHEGSLHSSTYENQDGRHISLKINIVPYTEYCL